MNRWEEQFNSHQIHQTLDQLEAWANRDFDNPTEDALIECRRFVKVLDAYRKHLEQVDPELLPFNQLEGVNSGLRNANIWNQVQAYSENGNPAHLQNANNNLSNQLTQLALFIAISKKAKVEKPLKTVEKGADKLAKIIEQSVSGFSSDMNSLGEEVANIRKDANELQKKVDTQKEETNTLINNWQEQFSNAQEKRVQEFSKLRDKLADDGMETIKELTEAGSQRLGDHFEQFKFRLQSMIDDSKNKHERILELYNIVAGDSVAAAYVENADNEKIQADLWRWMSFGFIIATVFWLGVAYYLNADADIGGAIHWPKVISTISLTGALLFGAAYSAQQSTRHRMNEQMTRRFALEVKAIDPFIASLEEEDRNSLKKMLSERLFGHSAHTGQGDAKVIDEHALGTVFKGITNILDKVKNN